LNLLIKLGIVVGLLVGAWFLQKEIASAIVGFVKVAFFDLIWFWLVVSLFVVIRLGTHRV